MFSIKKCPVPANTLLEKYSMNGSYTDCYSTEITDQVSFPEYIFAFYTTPLFNQRGDFKVHCKPSKMFRQGN